MGPISSNQIKVNQKKLTSPPNLSKKKLKKKSKLTYPAVLINGEFSAVERKVDPAALSRCAWSRRSAIANKWKENNIYCIPLMDPPFNNIPLLTYQPGVFLFRPPHF